MWQEPHSVTVSPKVVVMRASSSACPGMVSVVDAHTGQCGRRLILYFIVRLAGCNGALIDCCSNGGP